MFHVKHIAKNSFMICSSMNYVKIKSKNMANRSNKYNVLVIGGGHAGIEASYVAAKMGAKTALVTMDFSSIGRPSCNPSIGGTAKGHIVKEIDALGGAMPVIADKAGLQFKVLNKSKGPAVWSPRAQIDKDLYPKFALQFLMETRNLDLVKAKVDEILVKNDKVYGISTAEDEIIFCDAVILCAGTFLNGVMYTGMEATKGGRYKEPQANKISDLLNSYGFERGRLKTGTPPRVYESSVNFEALPINYGDENPEPFSYRTSEVKNRIVCYDTKTNEQTHDILRTGFDRSPMFRGLIDGVGPRYCPSIEDKIERFAGRDSHKIVLEPEGLNTDSIYVNGYSSSLPVDVQVEGLKSIKGLENVKLIRPAYAIEYDFFFPYQVKFTTETKAVSGLYFAGQINGTSGYEEAAGQGFVAGVNAVLKLRGEGEFTLKRSEAYIGVLIDDLVNKNTNEPYRIFTSLAEYRLLLRQDNADARLMKYGRQFGLIPERIYEKNQEVQELKAQGYDLMKDIKLKPDEVNPYLESIGEPPVKYTTDVYTLAKRSKVHLGDLLKLAEDRLNGAAPVYHNKKALEQLYIHIKYEGYINRQKKEISYFTDNEHKLIPDNFDYNRLTSLSNEALEKLNKIRPQSLGQASRISGVSAADVSVISLYLK